MPLYYAQYPTGRPAGANHTGRFVTGYLDAPNFGLYPFGYGLSYHRSHLENLRLSDTVLRPGGSIEAVVDLVNEGPVAGVDVVQLYLHDRVGSVTRPIKELKGFERVGTEPGERREVRFAVTEEMLAFWRRDMSYGTEPGAFDLMVGLSSQDVLAASFVLEA